MHNDHLPIQVAEYFEKQSPTTRKFLEEIREHILEAAPHAQEEMNYRIPAYTLIPGGKREEQIMIAGYEKHIGFYPHPTTIERFKDELSGYKHGKGSVQFALDQPIPGELVVRMVRYRLNLLQ